MVNLGNVLIFGDSYSTFEGYIPEGYSVYYGKVSACNNDITKVQETWWYPLIKEAGGNLVLNSAYSGSTICNTGYSGRSEGPDITFIQRLDCLIEKGFHKENKIDTILVCGSTNDSWANSPLGEEKTSGWEKEDLYDFLPAVNYFYHRLKENFKDARIISIFNTGLKDEITEGHKKACDRYGIETVELYDIDKIEGHPGITGMNQIKEQVLTYLNK